MTVIASIDVGLKRIGAALCLDGKTIIPQEAIKRKNRKQAAGDVSELLNMWDVDILVVGLPLAGGSEDEMGRRIRHFVSLLEVKEGMEIHYQDESGSSNEAKEKISGQIRHKKDGRIDSIAAKIILERWLFDR